MKIGKDINTIHKETYGHLYGEFFSRIDNYDSKRGKSDFLKSISNLEGAIVSEDNKKWIERRIQQLEEKNPSKYFRKISFFGYINKNKNPRPEMVNSYSLVELAKIMRIPYCIVTTLHDTWEVIEFLRQGSLNSDELVYALAVKILESKKRENFLRENREKKYRIIVGNSDKMEKMWSQAIELMHN